jgi:hypothetical protein
LQQALEDGGVVLVFYRERIIGVSETNKSLSMQRVKRQVKAG